MKQNLMQKHVKIQQHKIISTQTSRIQQFQQIDLSSKAFFISRQLLQSKYLFSKKALANHLQGKQIVLQQKNNQQPPSVLKGYMYLQQLQIIEEMIEVMIRINVLKQQKVNLKQKSTKRLYATTKYDWNQFPKVIIKIKCKQSLNNSKGKIKQNNQQKSDKQKSRLSLFIKEKTGLPINVLKRTQQLKMKTQREKQIEEQKKRKHDEQIRLNQQTQMRQYQLKKQQEQKIIKKQQQKQVHQSQMNNFWMKERQKIQEFVCPKNDISVLKSPNIKKDMKQRQQNNQYATQAAGQILQIQMKQLKEKQQQKKNPIKPLISWSFMKNTLGIDSSQSQNQTKQLKNKNIKTQKKEKIQIMPQNDLSVINETNSQQRFKNQKIDQFVTHKKILKNEQQKQSLKKTPCLGNRSYPKMQIEDSSVQLSLSSSTDITQTNYKIKNKKSGQKQKQIKITKKNDVFAENPGQSMFASSYYNSRRSTQTITTKRINEKAKQQKSVLKNKQCEFYSFKRKSTVNLNQQTLTVAAKPIIKTSPFQELNKVSKKYNNLSCNDNKKSILKRQSIQSDDQVIQTKTMALPKKMIERNNNQRISFYDHSDKLQQQNSSQTMTTPQPIRKNQKTSTIDLKRYSHTQYDGQIKRDSFVQELMADYFKKK